MSLPKPDELYVTSRCTVASFKKGELAIIGNVSKKTASKEEFALAKLFAAAPKMLAALKAMLDPMNAPLDSMAAKFPNQNQVDVARNMAMQAIAAVEGGAK